MVESIVNQETLRQLIANCRKASGRSLGFPRDWCPHRIPNPNSQGFFFTDASAWEFIADHLSSGGLYEIVPLNVPRGAMALVVKIVLPQCVRPLYVKVQIGAACRAIGRSFHLSERY